MEEKLPLGFVAANCTHDFDCPGALVCYENVKWSSVEAFCGCNTVYGWAGTSCAEFSAIGGLNLVSQGIMVIITASFMVLSFVDVVDLYLSKVHQKRLFPLAAIITQCTIFLALSCFLIWKSVSVASMLRPKLATVEEYNGEKRPAFLSLIKIMIVLTFAATLAAASFVSIVWLELAMTLKLNPMLAAMSVRKYRIAVFVCNLVYCAMLAGVAVMGRFGLGALLSFPFAFSLIVVFTIGNRRLTKNLRAMISIDINQDTGSNVANVSEQSMPAIDMAWSDSQASTHSVGMWVCSCKRRSKGLSSSPTERTLRAIAAIERCSINVILALVLMVLAAIAYILFLTDILHPGGWKNWGSPDQPNPLSGASEALAWSHLYLLLVIASYTHRNTKKIVHNAGRSSGKGVRALDSDVFGSSLAHESDQGPGYFDRMPQISSIHFDTSPSKGVDSTVRPET